jgi:hypothetical protein
MSTICTASCSGNQGMLGNKRKLIYVFGLFLLRLYIEIASDHSTILPRREKLDGYISYISNSARNLKMTQIIELLSNVMSLLAKYIPGHSHTVLEQQPLLVLEDFFSFNFFPFNFFSFDAFSFSISLLFLPPFREIYLPSKHSLNSCKFHGYKILES